jgi:hypothetical protein
MSDSGISFFLSLKPFNRQAATKNLLNRQDAKRAKKTIHYSAGQQARLLAKASRFLTL